MGVMLKSDHERIVRKIKKRTMLCHLVWVLVICCLLVSTYASKLERDGMAEGYGIVKEELESMKAKQELLVALRSKPLTISQALDITEIIVSQQEVPIPLLLAVIRQESEFKPWAISNKGARGLMQIVPATYTIYAGNPSLAHTRYIHDPVQNVHAGIAFLTDLKGTYGDWRKVLRAYFAGPEQAANKSYDSYANAVIRKAEQYKVQLGGDNNVNWSRFGPR